MSSVLAQTPSEYYRCSISIPVLDHLQSEFETRFTAISEQLCRAFIYLMPSVVVSKGVEEISPKICQLGEMYKGDLPHSSSLQSELHVTT